MIPTPSSQSEDSRRHIRIHKPDSPETFNPKRKHAFIADEMSVPKAAAKISPRPRTRRLVTPRCCPAELPTLGDLDQQTTGVNPTSGTQLVHMPRTIHGAYNSTTLHAILKRLQTVSLGHYSGGVTSTVCS